MNSAKPPANDGYYNFNEEYYTIWFAYIQSQQNNGGTAAPGIQKMWDKYDGRKKHPNKHYKGYDLLSKYSCYVPHLTYYMVNPFNTDDDFKRLFSDHH
jgi:hypothetical protein